jgi:hypothetical protein
MDSTSINCKFGDKLQAYYAFVRQVNRINGPDPGTPPADLTGQTPLADVTYAFGPMARLTAYGYFLGLEETPTLSSQSLGLRLSGDIPLNAAWSLPYAVEYATQDDYAVRPLEHLRRRRGHCACKMGIGFPILPSVFARPQSECGECGSIGLCSS